MSDPQGTADVLATDPLSDELQEALATIGLDVASPEKGLAPDALLSRLSNVGILIVGDTPVLKGALERAPRLTLIARTGVGASRVDLQAAAERGVVVTHAPECDAEARADRALMLVSMLDAGIAKGGVAGRGLQACRLGIVGDGKTAWMLARSASALGVRVRAWSPALTPARAVESGATYVDGLDALASQSDILCLAQPGLAVDDAVARNLPAGAHIVFAAPTTISEATLKSAMASKRIGVAALHDALDDAAREVALDHGATVLSAAHLDTAQTRSNIAISVMRSIREQLRHQPATTPLNLVPDGDTDQGTTLVVRHQTSADGLAGLFAQLKGADLDVTHLDNRVFLGGHTAVTRLRLGAPPSPTVLKRLRGITGVLGVDVIGS